MTKSGKTVLVRVLEKSVFLVITHIIKVIETENICQILSQYYIAIV